MKHRKFHLNMNQKFFILREVEHGNKLSGETVEPPPWKSYLNMVLGTMLLVSLLEQKLDQMDSEVPSNISYSTWERTAVLLVCQALLNLF